MEQPRLIVEVKWGRLAQSKAVVPAGGRLRVGRSELADFVVPHDGQMSAVHFELVWDGARCMLQDLGSIKGTELDGEMVKEAAVEHGGWIRAGQTDFSVYVEGRTLVRVEDEGDDTKEGEVSAEEHGQREAAEEALKVLRVNADEASLYAVLDAARDERIVELLRESVETYRSLYEGVDGQRLEDVAPYLVKLPAGSKLLEKLTREGWGKRWGIYLISRQPFKEVRRQLRRLLMVEDESGDALYFRFYDPQVLCTFFPTCTLPQKTQLLGEIQAIFAESGTTQLDQLECLQHVCLQTFRRVSE